MKHKCLYCYESIGSEVDFHEKCALAFYGSTNPPELPYSMDQMADLAKEVVERSISVPGVQPKLSMSILKETEESPQSRLTVVGALGGQFIFKPPHDNFKEMPENEHLTMRIAEAFGIRVMPSSLIRLKSGELSYITKRMDRTPGGEKIHMLDMYQITEAFDKYKSSMEKVGKAIHSYSENTLLDKIFFFEMTLFVFLTGNNDMHLKNFSMINSASGWVLAPGYDLLNVAIVNPEDTEELALTLEGRKKRLKRGDFERFGKGLGLSEKQILAAFQRMAKHKSLALAWIEKSFLSDQKRASYLNVLNARYVQINISDSTDK